MTELSKEALRSRARRAAAKPRKSAKAVARKADNAFKKKVLAGKVGTSDRLIVISFKGTPAHKAIFQGLGGGSWLRPMLDKRA